MELLTIFSQSKYQVEHLQLFSGIVEQELSRISELIGASDVMLVKAGQSVIAAQTTNDHLYIVLSGALEVQSHESTAESAVSNRRSTAGECVGELSVLDDEDQPHTIRALYDSELLVLKAETLWQLIDECNGVARNLLRLLSFRIRATNALLRRRHKVGEFYRQMSMIDGLTGIHNRAWLQNNLPRMIERAQLAGNDLSIIMVDLDHFKAFNDTHGHIAGDDAIQCAAKVLNSTLRPTDFAVRFGGEELLIILPETGQKACFTVAERLRSKIAQANIFQDNRLPLPHITASLGIASLMAGQDIFAFIRAADTALYRAKHAGRNQVSM